MTAGREPTGPEARLIPTPSQTVGPYLRIGMEWMQAKDLVAPGSAGAVTLVGTVTDGDGEVVPDAVLELWSPPAWGRSLTDDGGSYSFTVVKPAGAHRHMEMFVFARGLVRQLLTRIYFPDETDANLVDPLLARVPEQRRETLIAKRDPSGGLRFDVRLQGPDETVFFAY